MSGVQLPGQKKKKKKKQLEKRQTGSEEKKLLPGRHQQLKKKQSEEGGVQVGVASLLVTHGPAPSLPSSTDQDGLPDD